ncbi:RNA-binding domain-containing protein [Paramuribaculum intestinale]|uniref:RNA-binding domain-containing protein n=1 Tax=Paramuribaculum intestinale TaxID=2094151 RepID=UPI0026775BF5|nr:RNA-binding domain-containing protein [Paramuribaculum intestinale]
MDTPSSFSLDMLATYKENSLLEVKSARGGLPNSLWESYSAFANSEGGVIVLGVKENSKDGSLYVEGLDDVHKLLKDFWNMVNNRQKVSCNILTDSMAVPDRIEGKDVIVIRVPRAERTSRPVYVGSDPRTGTYRRNFEGDYHCSIDEVSLMIRDSALVTDDNKLLTDLDVSVFCPDTVKSYRNIFQLIRQNHLWNKEDDAMFLRRIGAVREDKDTGKFHPTVAGLLMFGYEYEITAVFPNYFLDYQENRTNGIYARWTDRITSQSGDWSGNVFDFLLRVIPKLQADLKVPFMFKGNHLDEDTPLHKTVREATVNMLANADFYGRRGVVVQKGVDGFRFANPGSMRVSLTEAIQDSASDPRNGVMMKMLAMVKYGERAGSGLQGIFKTWQSVYHCAPKLEVTTSGGVDRTTLTLGFEGHQPDIEAMKLLYDNPDELIEVSDTPKSKGESKDVPQNGESVLQNVPQNNINVLQNEEDIPQNESFDIKKEIVKLINEDLQITREHIAKELNISSKTVGRYLSKLGISWEGHPKTGHWKLP